MRRGSSRVGRVQLLISGWLRQNQRQKKGDPLSKPVTIVLLDDRKQDAYGNCQANDQRILCHVAPYNGAQTPLLLGTARTSVAYTNPAIVFIVLGSVLT